MTRHLSLCSRVPRSRPLLTQADVVVEEGEEVAALLPVVAARHAGAPGSHVGGGVVKVVGSYRASCSGGETPHSSVLFIGTLKRLMPHVIQAASCHREPGFFFFPCLIVNKHLAG